MAQPKALDCRSLRLHDYRSRILDRSSQRCVSSGPWVYWVLLQWPPHRRHPLCWSYRDGPIVWAPIPLKDLRTPWIPSGLDVLKLQSNIQLEDL